MSVLNPLQKPNLLNLDLKFLTQFFTELGEKSFRALQVFKWIHMRGVSDFSEMTDLSVSLRDRLTQLAEIKAPFIAEEQCSVDGTRKWLMAVEGNNHIETVFIPEKDRGTLCVSSQVGCALNCRFCSTATQGFNRNLTVAEIIGQVWLAKQQLMKVATLENQKMPGITNVVMMGMGEPLLNFEAVVSAMSMMRHDAAYALPRRRVTLSTSGIVPKIDELAELSDVSLAVSLHAPIDSLRNILVPINKKYPISALMDACKRYVAKDKRRQITMEYVMLRDVNDKPEHAKKLIKILQNVPCKVNLIPFNPFFGSQYQRSTTETILHFQDQLMKTGIITTIRKTRGEDIDAACGQLKGRVMDKTRRKEKFEMSQKLMIKRRSETEECGARQNTA